MNIRLEFLRGAGLKWRALPAPLSIVIAAILLLGAPLAHGNSVVNSTGDGGLVYGGKYGCESDLLRGGVCTLRAAIEFANLNPDVDTITFNIPGTAPYTISLGSPLPDLSTAMNISGPGVAKLTVAGNGAPEFGSAGSFRVFNVTTSGTITFSGITIARGGLVGTSGNGGGIQNASGGTVNVTNCILTDNSSGEKYDMTFPFGGGAIYNGNGGTLNVTGSTFRRNIAAFEVTGYGGGAILNNTGTLTVAQSTFEDNHTNRTGGAIFTVSGALTVTGSTFQHNGATGGAGAIYNQGVASLTNSTFVGNIAYSIYLSQPEVYPQGSGGAILNLYNSTLNLSNCTITANFAESGGGIVSGVNSGSTVNVRSTIIAGNYAGKFFGAAPDVIGPFISKGFNLIGIKDGSTGFTLATDKKGTIATPLNPKFDLKGLRNNGGPTETISLQTGSPAIDKGTSVTIAGTTLTTDQRGTGYPRRFDNTSVANVTGGDGTDIGAFERQVP